MDGLSGFEDFEDKPKSIGSLNMKKVHRQDQVQVKAIAGQVEGKGEWGSSLLAASKMI